MKEVYRELCRQEPSIPIFSRDWWLDATCCENNWDVVLVEKDGVVVAAMPFLVRTRLSKIYLGQPALTQKLGPWIRYPDTIKRAKKIALEIELMTRLIGALPRFDHFEQTFDYSYRNWLPFYWQGFHQTTNYTYVIDDIQAPEEVLAKFSHSKRKDIKKALKVVEVKFDMSAEDFYRHHMRTLLQRDKTISYSPKLLENILNACHLNDAGRIIYAIDVNGAVHAALLVIWDEESAYNLISTIDQDHSSSGATSLLILEMIKYLSDKTKRFDFEGSMIQGVEFSFRQFGTEQMPMHRVSKTNSKLIDFANYSRKIVALLRK